MQIYFSHSYRDVSVNGYFIERLADDDIPLRADQKTDVWCVAKLERYLYESTGFISVITRRPSDEDIAGYSPYIGRELNLARRARVPRLLFVDEQVLHRHRLDFPEDAVPFRPEALADDAVRHDAVIQQFMLSIETASRMDRRFSPGNAVIVAPASGILRDAAHDVAEILRRQHFYVSNLMTKFEDRGLDDIRLLEALWRAELCVFLLSEKLSDAHVALALAHAHCIPSIRLRYDHLSSECAVAISGTIRWRDRTKMLAELDRQVSGYREGLVRPIEIAQASSPAGAARTIASMRWRPRDDNLWEMRNGYALLSHVRPEQSFIQDEVNRVRRAYGSPLTQAHGRESSMQLCRLIYEGVWRHRFGFEFEPFNPEPGIQVIRTPAQIETHRTANCLDLTCLFAALLEAAGQRPIIVVIDGPSFAHALIGARAPGEPAWRNPQQGDLRRALAFGDAVFFEPTGAVESDFPVAAERQQERQDKLLDFMSAKSAAERMIERTDIRVRCILDVVAIRNNPN